MPPSVPERISGRGSSATSANSSRSRPWSSTSWGGDRPQRFLGRDLFWWLEATGLIRKTVESRIGRRLEGRDTLIGSDARTLKRRHGVHLRGRAVDAAGRTVSFDDGENVDVEGVVWATGFAVDHSWIDAPVFYAGGRVVHKRGVTESPGLYFLGLSWLYTRGSALLGSGTRPSMDRGVLGITAASAPGNGGGASRRPHRPWSEWSTPKFGVDAAGPIAAGVDGEAMTLDAPLRFRTRPGVLRVRIASAHPGASPSANIPEGLW